MISTNPFAREGTVTLFGDSVYYGYDDSLHFEVRTLEGRRLSGFAYPYDNAPVAPAEIDSVAAGKDFESVRSAVRSQAPDTWPAWDSYLVVGDGSLLVGLRTELGQPTEWARFDPEGRYLGSFTLPPAVRIYDTAGDTLYAVHRNPLDVPRIRVYELERIGSRSR